MVAMALRLRDVKIVVTTQAPITPIVSRIPACPAIKGTRMNRMTPRMFCKHGKKTPHSVFKPANVAAGEVLCFEQLPVELHTFWLCIVSSHGSATRMNS